MVFHLSLSDSKSPQVSGTRLRILPVLSNAVIWIVSLRPPTYKSSRPFINPLVIVPKAPITIGTIVTFIFRSFFNSLARSRYLSFFSHSFSFILWSAGTAKSTIIIIIIIIIICKSFPPVLACSFYWSLIHMHDSDGKENGCSVKSATFVMLLAPSVLQVCGTLSRLTFFRGRTHLPITPWSISVMTASLRTCCRYYKWKKRSMVIDKILSRTQHAKHETLKHT